MACYALFAVIILLAINPHPVISATFRGLSVWAKIVLPSLFCFFILSKILMQRPSSFVMFMPLDKPFAKAFGVRRFGGYVMMMSALTGYPLGAKLIYEFRSQGLISQIDAKKMIAFCSTSGPMFVVGSVGISMFGDARLGLIVFVCHILSSFLNGFLYRNLGTKSADFQQNLSEKLPKIKKETLNEIMYSSIISVLMIGGYITICFSLLEVVTNLKLFEIANNFFAKMFGSNIFESVVKGVVEVTNGCVNLASGGLPATILVVLSCCLVSFGGLSIHLQSQLFLSKIGVSYRYFFLTKITQTLIAFGLSLIASLIFL